MRPHEHFLVAFLPVFVYVLLRYRRIPSKGMVFVLVIGSQLPDLVDKPLAFSIGILPSGRVFMHSLPFALPLAVLVLVYAWATDRSYLGIGFVWAHLLHLAGDFRFSLFKGQIPPDLIWPFAPASPSPDIPFWARNTPVTVEIWTAFSVLVIGTAVIMFSADVVSQLRHSTG